MIEIEKNIPMPHTRPVEFPIVEMDIGDSFFVKCENEKIKEYKTRIRIRNKIRAEMVKHEIIRNYTVRKVEGGFRVWRIS